MSLCYADCYLVSAVELSVNLLYVVALRSIQVGLFLNFLGLEGLAIRHAAIGSRKTQLRLYPGADIIKLFSFPV